MTEKKAKRRLSGFDFSHEGAHVALVHKEQGGAANGFNTLVMKSAANFSEEFIQKLQQVRVTMELDDYLETFFHLWDDDAAILAAMMGYKEEADGEGEPAGVYNDESFYCWYEDKMKKAGYEGSYWNMPEPTTADHQEWIAMRLEGIELLKSLKESDSLAETISKLSEKDYMTVVRDQERFEKALAKKESVVVAIAKAKASAQQPPAAEIKPKSRIVKKATENAKAVVQAEPKNVAKAAIPEVKKMTDKVTVVEQTIETEMVSKSQFDEIQKAFEAQKEAIEKANALIAAFESEKKEAIAKARKAAIGEVVAKEDDAAVLFKAVAEIADADFEAVVGVLKALAAKADESVMFKEVGVSIEGDGVQVEKSSVLKARLEAKYKK